jgi:hypothetical protein
MSDHIDKFMRIKEREPRWVIVHKFKKTDWGEIILWSKALGWTLQPEHDVYKEDQKGIVPLPDDGVWVREDQVMDRTVHGGNADSHFF